MLAGSLTEFGLADVFSLLAATRKTGVLNLESDATQGRVWIASGGLCYAVADVTRSPLAARLLHGGEADVAQIEAVIAAQAGGELGTVEDALREAGVAADRARALLLDQVVDAVFDLSRWEDGTFSFDQRDAADVVPVATANDVLGQVSDRLSEWQGIADRAPALDAVLEPVSRPPVGPDGVVINPAHWEVLTLLDGLRSVTDVIDLTGQGQFVTLRILTELDNTGLVQQVEVPTGITAAQHRHRTLLDAEQRLLGAPAREFASPIVATPSPSPVLEAPAPEEPTEADPAAVVEPAPSESPQDQPAESPTVLDEPVVDAPTVEAPTAEAEQAEQAEQPVAEAEEFTDATEPEPEPEVEHAPEPQADSGTQPTAEEQRRARELAALGLAPDPDAGTPEQAQEQGKRPPARDRNVDADLLARLIDGVKGA